MKSTIYQSPVCEMKELNNLFIEMTAKNCNMKCRKCYIDFPLSRNVKDFMSLDKIKQSIEDTRTEKIETIYLTGAEPMTHPDFNSILRLCLSRSNTCICTNGSFINEKKARFLKRVQDESNYEIIFQLSLCHWDEDENDEIRSRGALRQTLHAIKYLSKYGFNPIIIFSNYYKLNKKDIFENCSKLMNSNNFKITKSNLKINIWQDANVNEDEVEWNWESLDCERGRTLTQNGVYTCPFLCGDHRGRSGSDFKDFSKKAALETNICSTCLKNKTAMFSIDYSLFEAE